MKSEFVIRIENPAKRAREARLPVTAIRDVYARTISVVPESKERNVAKPGLTQLWGVRYRMD